MHVKHINVEIVGGDIKTFEHLSTIQQAGNRYKQPANVLLSLANKSLIAPDLAHKSHNFSCHSHLQQQQYVSNYGQNKNTLISEINHWMFWWITGYHEVIVGKLTSVRVVLFTACCKI